MKLCLFFNAISQKVVDPMKLTKCHTPFREIGTKPPYVCLGCSNHTHGNNMINRCNVFNITSNSSYIMTRGSEKDYIKAVEITKRSAAPQA
jgi:hypothetical protein